jgi:uracil-DNA glycosylase family 4
MNNFCEGCPYNQNGDRYTPPNNRDYSPLKKEDNNSDVLLVFQSPGESEWDRGLPLQNCINGAGLRIQTSLQRIGKTRTDFDITNSVQCYQGKGGNKRDKKPVKGAMQKCRNYLKSDMESKRYRKIIVFGAIAKEQVVALGYNFGADERLIHLKHPTGGVTNETLDQALNT